MCKRVFIAILCALFLFTVFPVGAMANRVPVPVSDDAVGAARKLSGLDSAADFGGVYLTENAAKVVVLLVKATEARKNEIRAMVENPDILVFKAAKYSVKELQSVFDQIDSNGKFEWTTYGIDIMGNCVEVNVYYGGEAAAREYFKKFGGKVKVIGSDFVPKLDEYDAIEITNEAWIREVFPDAKEFTTTNTLFVFSGAPKVTKTRAVLNKLGESLTLYRFANKKDYEKCKAMVKGTSLVYGGNVVYVDTSFASTYFYNEKSNMLALYCGSTQRIFGRLEDRNFFPAGGLGGFFASRGWSIYQHADVATLPHEDTPDSPKKLAKLSDGIVRGIIKSVPASKGNTYTLTVRESIRGKFSGTITVTTMPGVMEKGRSYILFLKQDIINGKSVLSLMDEVHFSSFELNDKGYVLPIREYGMTKPVTQTAFIKGL